MTKNTVAWLTHIDHGVMKRHRVTIIEDNGNGFVRTFKWKGKIFTIDTDGTVSDGKGGFVNGYKLVATAATVKRNWIESECRRACDPNSERFWTM
jgi:7-keto-8-aminopelargonate synthetase-like enzyme